LKGKLVVRYFYNPICPETFATLERLQLVFGNNENIFFESFNVVEEDIKSKKTWFEVERKLINTFIGSGEIPLSYAKLFIDGEEIDGFPPSKNKIKEILIDKEVLIDTEKYTYDYGTCPPRERQDCDSSKFTIVSYKQNYQIDNCKICIKHHPYLTENIYDISKWEKHEIQKHDYIKKKLSNGEMIGLTAYYEDRPAGFIEAFIKCESIRLGYPTKSKDNDTFVITCLSICPEFSQYRLANKLIKELEVSVKSSDFKYIEALCFPDEHNWQPYTLYSKLNYIQEVEYESGLILVKKSLIDVRAQKHN
jgi:ribosomal protein S18 acetylase RimI-like enzyme